MSDESDKQPPKPPKPMKKTSAVPLKKETVRVTLKATPEGGDAPKSEEKSSGSVPAPAPTIPLKTAKLGGGDEAKKPAAPAPTVQLKTPGTTTAPKTTPLQTQPLNAPSGTQALPKATVQLGSATQALGAPTALSATQAATIQTAADDEEEENELVPGILSLVAFIAALAVLGIQVMATSQWVSKEDPVNNASGWNKLFE